MGCGRGRRRTDDDDQVGVLLLSLPRRLFGPVFEVHYIIQRCLFPSSSLHGCPPRRLRVRSPTPHLLIVVYPEPALRSPRTLSANHTLVPKRALCHPRFFPPPRSLLSLDMNGVPYPRTQWTPHRAHLIAATPATCTIKRYSSIFYTAYLPYQTTLTSGEFHFILIPPV